MSTLTAVAPAETQWKNRTKLTSARGQVTTHSYQIYFQLRHFKNNDSDLKFSVSPQRTQTVKCDSKTHQSTVLSVLLVYCICACTALYRPLLNLPWTYSTFMGIHSLSYSSCIEFIKRVRSVCDCFLCMSVHVLYVCNIPCKCTRAKTCHVNATCTPCANVEKLSYMLVCLRRSNPEARQVAFCGHHRHLVFIILYVCVRAVHV